MDTKIIGAIVIIFVILGMAVLSWITLRLRKVNGNSFGGSDEYYLP